MHLLQISPRLSFQIVISFLIGCGPKWVKLDDSDATSDEIEIAKSRCQVDEGQEFIKRTKKTIDEMTFQGISEQDPMMVFLRIKFEEKQSRANAACKEGDISLQRTVSNP